MSGKVMVEISQLEKAEKKILECTERYKKAYEELYSEVDEMGTNWNDERNLRFTRDIDQFRDKFVKMEKLMSDYGNHCGISAKKYRQWEQGNT